MCLSVCWRVRCFRAVLCCAVLPWCFVSSLCCAITLPFLGSGRRRFGSPTASSREVGRAFLYISLGSDGPVSVGFLDGGEQAEGRGREVTWAGEKSGSVGALHGCLCIPRCCCALCIFLPPRQAEKEKLLCTDNMRRPWIRAF